jgi:hypothetical protein
MKAMSPLAVQRIYLSWYGPEEHQTMQGSVWWLLSTLDYRLTNLDFIRTLSRRLRA